MSRKTYLLTELAAHLGGTIKGDPAVVIEGVGALEDAGPGELSFINHERHLPLLDRSRASAFIVPPNLDHIDRSLLICDQPYLAMARAAQLFYQLPHLDEGVDATAHLGEGVVLGKDVRLGPLVHVGKNSRIGDRTRIYGGVYVGGEVEIGPDCVLHPSVTVLDRCRLGSRVIIQSGAVIGSDGFGYAQDESGRHVKIPQTGLVQIDDDVEIGANCCIDRATFGRTWVQRGTKIDNLVHVAHNVVIGEHSIVIAQVGISGSTRIGRRVVLAGQAGIVGHIEIGDGARVGAQAGVHKSVKAGEDVVGSPALPFKDFAQVAASWKRLPHAMKELKALQEKVQRLEATLSGNDYGKRHPGNT